MLPVTPAHMEGRLSRTVFTSDFIKKIAADFGIQGSSKIRELKEGLRLLDSSLPLYLNVDSAPSPTRIIVAGRNFLTAAKGQAARTRAQRDRLEKLATDPALIPFIEWEIAREHEPKYPEKAITSGASRKRFDEMLKNDLSGLIIIVEHISRSAKRRPGRGGARHKSNDARDYIVRELLVTYRRATGINLLEGRSLFKRSGAGPAVEFVYRCLQEIAEMKHATPRAIEKQIERVLLRHKKNPTSYDLG